MRVAILRALPGLGDLLSLVPTLRALRRHEVTLIGPAEHEDVAKRYVEYVDRFAPFPGWPGIPGPPVDRAKAAAFLEELKAERFHLALQLHDPGPGSAGLVRMLGAADTGGFHAHNVPAPGDGWLPWVDAEHEVLRPLRLLEHLGLGTDGDELEFPVDAGDRRAAAALGLPEPYAVLHPGASSPERCWPPDRYAAAADALYQRGLAPVLTGAPRDAGAVRAVLGAAELPVVSVAGRTTVGALAAVLRGASVVVTNDAGPAQLAAAVGTPCVAAYTATDPAFRAPPGTRLHRPLRGDVEVRSVLREADELLSER